MTDPKEWSDKCFKELDEHSPIDFTLEEMDREIEDELGY